MTKLLATAYNSTSGKYEEIKLYGYQQRMLNAYRNYGEPRAEGIRTIILAPRQMGRTMTKLLATAQLLVSGERRQAVILVSAFNLVSMVSDHLHRFLESVGGVGVARNKMSNTLRLDNGAVVTIATLSGWERVVRGTRTDLIVMDDVDCSNGGERQRMAIDVADYAQRNQIDVIASTCTYVKRAGEPSVFEMAVNGDNDFRYEVFSYKDHPKFGGSQRWYEEMMAVMGPDVFDREFLCGL